MAGTVKFGISTRGKPTLIRGTYEFVKLRDTKNGKIHWRCRYYVSDKCKALIHTKDNTIIKEINGHTHDARPYSACARRLIGEMKEAMKTPGATGKLVTAHALTNASDGVKMVLPKKTTLSRTLQRTKAATSDTPANPTDINFEIPPQYEHMVLYDSGVDDPNRIILLGHKDLLQLLESKKQWICDGTFKVVPELFYQLYSIHVQLEGIAFACILALLPKKTEAIYVKLCQAIIELVPDANPDTILLDFEKAAMNAFQTCYSRASIKGCYFHLTKSVGRKISDLDLQEPYDDNEDDLAIHVKMLCATSLLPEEDVLDGFLDVVEIFPMQNDPKIQEFLTYFERTYVRGIEMRNGRRRDPLFKVEIWNHNESVLDGVARSTNSVEGFHYSLQALFQCSHPNVWKFLQGMNGEIALQHKNFLSHSVGHRIPPRRRYVDLKVRLQNIVNDYDENKKINFLRAIAHTS